MNENLRREEYSCDFCVIGGGLSGSFAAIAAARSGAKVILLQDRPVLGGNASSEVRMWVRGCKNPADREQGYISELEERNIRHNPNLSPTTFDATLYDMVVSEPNIRLFLNTSVMDCEAKDGKIISVTGWQLTTYTFLTVKADYFADCSGDSILAPLCGAEYRHGREAASEFGETLAGETADGCTMGMSVILAARETDHPVKFIPPAFAYDYPTDESFSGGVGAASRSHQIGTSGGNLWWIELGGNMDTIYDADRVREDLIRCVYGVWDHIKNHGDHGMENWELEWVGSLPGKRESRRYVGDLILSEKDLTSGGHFSDEIAYGGWELDDHNPLGMKADGGAPSRIIPVPEPYGIPYRVLYSENIENLFFAGRNISVTHMALSSTRVMATCSLLGQAMGTAAGLAVKYGCTPREVGREHISELQRILQNEGMTLPHHPRKQSETFLSANVGNLTGEEKEILFNGLERPSRDGQADNAITLPVGGEITFSWEKPTKIGTLRFKFDPDFSRLSISENKKMRVFAMKLHTGKDFVPVRVAKTLVSDFTVFADGEKAAEVKDNYLALRHVPVDRTVSTLSVRFEKTNGADAVRLYSLDEE